MLKINTLYKTFIMFVLYWAVSTVLPTQYLVAGNRDRAGQAGAGELLINPWARSSGFHGLNVAGITGIEALNNNAGGLARLRGKTEVAFCNTQWLKGSDTKINALGLGLRLSENSVLGISLMSMGFGDIEVTTYNQPDGGTAQTFSPQFLNIGIGYARSFSKSIHVGFVGRLINESISDVSASGFALDMGIQYVTGAKENIKFGIALRNIGTPLRFKGDGLSYKFPVETEQTYNLTAEQRSEKFELPSLLHIGLGYDWHLTEAMRLSFLGNFTSNSFTKDHIGGGIEYAFKEMFMVRAGYRYESGITSTDFNAIDANARTNVHTGLSAGATLEVPIKTDGPRIGFDYSFRASNPYSGTHSVGLRIIL